MRQRLCWVLGLWCVSAAEICAQSAPTANFPEAGAVLECDQPAQDCYTGPRCWAGAEYLLWWVKNAPLAVPIVTTGDPNVGFDPTFQNTVNTAGALGQPGTQVLYGGKSIDYSALSGARFTLGGWFCPEPWIGVEGSGFVLERQSKTFSASSDNAGNPPLYFPIFSGIASAERGIPIADPLRAFSGDVAVTSSLQLWGAELNELFNVTHRPGLECCMLVGFRYADLREHLHIHNSTTDLIFGDVTVLNDSFATTNQFYGAQVGARLALQYSRLSLSVAGKFGLGLTHELVNVQGNITQLGPNPIVPPGLGTFPGGLFAQSSNIGKRSADQFTILPALELKLGYQVTQHIGVTAGYDILYWNQVVRPGNQIDHNVNLSQNAVLTPNPSGTVTEAPTPAPQFNTSSFWAEGFSCGLEVRF